MNNNCYRFCVVLIYEHCCPVKYKPVPLTADRGLLEVMNTQLNQDGEDLSVIAYS